MSPRTAATQEPAAAGEKRSLADRYRQAAFDLLKAARLLDATAREISKTAVRVWPSADADLTEAVGLLKVGVVDLVETRRILGEMVQPRVQGARKAAPPNGKGMKRG